MGFEPTLPEGNGLAVHRLNHSATSSTCFDAIRNIGMSISMTPNVGSLMHISVCFPKFWLVASLLDK